ncbi:MAG: hypothetical protein N2316_03380 [Spirochaetes bacterium]|nr:hypothetical protein [Spirochaetota bacterium]
MKRIVLCASLLAIALVCSACSEDDPQVRVQTMFVSITYGIKFQDADGDQLDPILLRIIKKPIQECIVCN